MGTSVLASKCLSQSTFLNANRSNQLPAGPGKHRIRVAATALAENEIDHPASSFTDWPFRPLGPDAITGPPSSLSSSLAWRSHGGCCNGKRWPPVQ